MRTCIEGLPVTGKPSYRRGNYLNERMENGQSPCNFLSSECHPSPELLNILLTIKNELSKRIPVSIPCHIDASWPEVFRNHACDRHKFWKDFLKKWWERVTSLLACGWENVSAATSTKKCSCSQMRLKVTKGDCNCWRSHDFGQLKCPCFKLVFVKLVVAEKSRICCTASGGAD